MDMNHKKFADWLVMQGLFAQFVFDSIEGKDLSTYVVRYGEAIREGL